MSEFKEKMVKRKINPKSIAIDVGLLLISASYGGIAQFFSEQETAIVKNSAVKKFANEINFTEEFLEGSIPVVAGMAVGKLFYLFSVNTLKARPGRDLEIGCMLTGGFLGYVSMMALGDVLHQMTGSPDVKWGPFK